jgi:hypothetical protein
MGLKLIRKTQFQNTSISDLVKVKVDVFVNIDQLEVQMVHPAVGGILRFW